MTTVHSPSDRVQRIQTLVRRLLATEAELRVLTDGGVDAVIDPTDSTPLLLREAQTSLRQAEARWRDLIARLPIIACEVDRGGLVRFVSDAASNILGGSPSDLVGRPWVEALRVQENDGRIPALAEREIAHYDLPIRARDGSVREVLWSSKHVLGPDGTLDRVLLFGLDLTERRRAEESARQLVGEQAARAAAEASERRSTLLSEAGRLLGSALRYEATLTSIARLAVSGLADYCIVDVLESDGRLRRIDVAHPDLAASDPLRERLASDDPAEGGPPLIERVIRTGRTLVVGGATWREAADLVGGELATGLIGRSIVCAPLGARGHVLGALTVISAANTSDYAPADVALVEELARRAALAVDNARLYEAALSASEAKSEFLAMMSHELRTPLNAIMGYADLLLLGIPERVPAAATRHVHRIRIAATHLLQMIDEILTLSRIEAGEEVIEPSDFEMCAFVKETATLVEPLAAAKQLAFSCRTPEAEIPVRMDARKVRQILLNLLGNAVKFTSRGHVSVETTLDGEEVVVSVEDTGMGIAPEHHQRIFEPFWQVSQEGSGRNEGTGLGLNLARRLAHAMGGDLTLLSELNVGTRVELRLPRVFTGNLRVPPT